MGQRRGVGDGPALRKAGKKNVCARHAALILPLDELPDRLLGPQEPGDIHGATIAVQRNDVVPRRHDIAAIAGHWNVGCVRKNEADAGTILEFQLRHDRFEIRAIGAETVHPDHGKPRHRGGLDFDGGQQLVHVALLVLHPAEMLSLRSALPVRHRLEADQHEHDAADHGDQAAEPHHAHPYLLRQRGQGLLGAGHLALHTVAAGPRQAEDMDQLSAAIHIGLPARHAALHRAEAQLRQQHVGEAHEGQRDADRGAMIVRRDDDVGALDHVGEHAPHGKQGEGSDEGGLGGVSLGLAYRPQAEKAHQNQRRHVGMAPDHQLGEEFHVRQFARRNREVDRGHHQQRQRGDPEHGRQGARRRHRRLAEMGGDRQPRHHHQDRMLELQGMAAAPEQHLEVELGLDFRIPRHNQPGPGKGSKCQKSRHRAEECAELQRCAEERPRPGSDQRAQHGQAETRAAKPQRGIEDVLLQYRDVVVE